MMKSFVLLHLLLVTTWVWADEPEPIGRITAVQQREENPITILDENKKQRGACVDCPVFESDTIITKRKQVLSLILDEGTEVTVGAESVVALSNWTKKDSQGHLKRSFNLINGVIRAVINKIYSQEEPFLVKSRTAVMGVRGTDFIVSSRERRRDKFESAQTVTLYTIQGDVHFAKNEKELEKGNYVSTQGGFKSVMNSELSRPTLPARFESQELKQTFEKRMPQVNSAQVTRNTPTAKEERIKSAVMPRPEAVQALKSKIQGGSGGVVQGIKNLNGTGQSQSARGGPGYRADAHSVRQEGHDKHSETQSGSTASTHRARLRGEKETTPLGQAQQYRDAIRSHNAAERRQNVEGMSGSAGSPLGGGPGGRPGMPGNMGSGPPRGRMGGAGGSQMPGPGGANMPRQPMPPPPPPPPNTGGATGP